MPSSRPSLQALDGNARRHGWRAEVLSRVRRHFWLKTIGISAFMSLFFFAYFQVLRHPAGPVFVMPLTALDRTIDLQPSWLAVYLTLWVYVGIPPGLLLRLRTLVVYGGWIGALCLCALVIFYLWPTAVAPPEITVDLARHPAFALLQGVDAAGNACPSLHVATAVFTAVWLHRALPRLAAPGALVVANWLWCAGIVYSTVAIGQHVVLDVVGGIALALAFAWPASRWLHVDDHRR